MNQNRKYNLKIIRFIFILALMVAIPSFIIKWEKFIRNYERAINRQENEYKLRAENWSLKQKLNQMENTPSDTIKKNQGISQDTIQYDNVFYPEVHFPEYPGDYYDTNFIKQLLRTGEFHREVVWSGAEEVKWFGLFQNDSGFYLSDTKIRTESVHVENDCNENNSEKTGLKVQIINKDTCVILIPEFDFLKNHKILQADLSQYISKNLLQYPDYVIYNIANYEEQYPLRTKSRFLPGNQIFPGDTVKLNYLGVDYKIYATGGKSHEHRYLFEWNAIINYKLYLSANKNGKIINQLLIAQPDTREMISILVAGDIDGDGLLDLLIERTYHYEIKTLYLSKPADNGHLLKVVGELRNPEPPCC